MFYEKDAFKQLKKQTSRDCVVALANAKAIKISPNKSRSALSLPIKESFWNAPKGRMLLCGWNRSLHISNRKTPCSFALLMRQQKN